MLNLSGYVVLGLLIISPNLGGGNNQDDFMGLSQSSVLGLVLVIQTAASHKQQSDQCWLTEGCREQSFMSGFCVDTVIYIIVGNLIFITINIFSGAPARQMMYFLLRKGSRNQIIKDQWFPTTGRFTRNLCRREENYWVDSSACWGQGQADT